MFSAETKQARDRQSWGQALTRSSPEATLCLSTDLGVYQSKLSLSARVVARKSTLSLTVLSLIPAFSESLVAAVHTIMGRIIMQTQLVLAVNSLKILMMADSL